VIWGTGTPRREFLYSDDMADACVFLMEKCDAEEVGEFVNIGTGIDQTIAELAHVVAEAVGFKGRLVFDTSKPDGTPQKLLDVSRLAGLGWRAKTDLKDGLVSAYREFLSRFEATSSNELR
jgi:GDP-L-fucose synthase